MNYQKKPQIVPAIQHEDFDTTSAFLQAQGFDGDVDDTLSDGKLSFTPPGATAPVTVNKCDYVKFEDDALASQDATSFEANYELVPDTDTQIATDTEAAPASDASAS
jgi:hypothetical protein